MISNITKIRVYAELNPAHDEWHVTGNAKAWGIYGAHGWCLAGVLYLWPHSVWFIVFNRGIGMVKKGGRHG